MSTEDIVKQLQEKTDLELTALDLMCQEIIRKSSCCCDHMEAGNQALVLIDRMATSIIMRFFDQLFTMMVDDEEPEDLEPLFASMKVEFEGLRTKVQRDILGRINQRNSDTLH